MRSDQLGASTSAPEVTNVSPHGIWLLLDGKEHALPFDEFPWFRNATIAELHEVERPVPHHLSWSKPGIDLHVDSLEKPDAYPLVSGVRAGE